MTQQDDITQPLLKDDEFLALFRYYVERYESGRIPKTARERTIFMMLSKLRAEGVQLCTICQGYGQYQDGNSGTDADGRAPHIVECECDDSERRPDCRRTAPVASAPADHGFAPMPPTQDRQPDDIPGYLESDKEWIDRHLNAVRWLIDNHAAVRAALASAPVADESPMAKMADALREKARQEQQTYQDRRAQASEWGPLPEGTEADLLTRNAPVAHVAGDETSRYLDWAKDRSAWEMPVGTPVYYSALASAPVADERAAPQVKAGNQYHILKTDPAVFQAVLDGAKTFEIRMNDRGYAVGDVLGLRETKHTGAEMRAGAPLVYTGRECQRFVSHVLTGYGLADGWCCLSFDLPHAGGASAPVADERDTALRRAVNLLLQVHPLLGPCDHELRDRIGAFLGKGNAA